MLASDDDIRFADQLSNHGCPAILLAYRLHYASGLYLRLSSSDQSMTDNSGMNVPEQAWLDGVYLMPY